MHENRETSAVPETDVAAGRSVKDQNRTTGMHAVEESDSGIVPMNPSNKGDVPSSAEVGAGRPGIKENVAPSHTRLTQSGERVLGIARRASTSQGKQAGTVHRVAAPGIAG